MMSEIKKWTEEECLDFKNKCTFKDKVTKKQRPCRYNEIPNNVIYTNTGLIKKKCEYALSSILYHYGVNETGYWSLKPKQKIKPFTEKDWQQFMNKPVWIEELNGKSLITLYNDDGVTIADKFYTYAEATVKLKFGGPDGEPFGKKVPELF